MKHFETFFLGGGGDYRWKRCFHSNTKFYCLFESLSFAKLSQHFCRWLYLRRQCGYLKFWKSRVEVPFLTTMQLDLFQVVPGSTPQLCLHIVNWSGYLFYFSSLLNWPWKAPEGRGKVSVVFCWLRNERSGKHFSHTRLGVWVQVCGGFQVTWLM